MDLQDFAIAPSLANEELALQELLDRIQRRPNLRDSIQQTALGCRKTESVSSHTPEPDTIEHFRIVGGCTAPKWCAEDGMPKQICIMSRCCGPSRWARRRRILAAHKSEPSFPDAPPPDEELRLTQITQTIFEHAARISRESDLSKLLQSNADLARDLTGADRCSPWLIDEQTGEMWTKVAHGTREIRIPTGAGIVGACMVEDRSLLVNHLNLTRASYAA